MDEKMAMLELKGEKKNKLSRSLGRVNNPDTNLMEGMTKTVIKGMTELHRKILGFFGERTLAIYHISLE